MFFVLSFIALFSQQIFSQELTTEDAIFDTHHTSRTSELLLQEYKRKQILFLGASTHANFRHFNHLRELLALVGNDPNLKYIIFERPHEISGFYESLSTETLESSLAKFQFPSEQSKFSSLCFSPEWAYSIGNFIPWLRQLNLNERPLNPILIKGVDSYSSNQALPSGNEPKIPLDNGTCTTASMGFPTNSGNLIFMQMAGATREKETAKNFENEIWKSLKPNEKVIVLYYYGHLIDFEACMPELGVNGRWMLNFVPATWLKYFLEANPSANSAYSFVALDEKDIAYNPNGIFKLTQRQFKRHPYNFGIALNHFEGTTKEVGVEVFNDRAWWRQRFSPPISSKSLHQLVDGIIWNSEPYKDYVIKGSHTYLPDHCPQ